MPLTNDNKNKLRELRDHYQEETDHVLGCLTHDLSDLLLENDVSIGIDRNTCNDFIARGKELKAEDLKFTLPYQAMVLEVNREMKIPLNNENMQTLSPIESEKLIQNWDEKCLIDITLKKIYMFNGNITENKLDNEDISVLLYWDKIVERVMKARSEEELNLIHNDILNSVFGVVYKITQMRELDKALDSYRHGFSLMKGYCEAQQIFEGNDNHFRDFVEQRDANNLIVPNRFDCIKKSMLLAIHHLPIWNLVNHTYDRESTDRQGIFVYAEIEDMNGTLKWYSMMFSPETISGVYNRYCYLFSLDGIINTIYYDIIALIKGFVNAWNKKAITEVWKKRNLRMPSIGRQKYRFKRVKEKFFKYDSEKGRIEVTKTVVVDPAPEIRVSQGGIKSPHMRSECMAYVWVSIKNVGKDEEWIDERETKNNILVKVLRPRASAKVNGGGNIQAQIRCN